MLPLMYVLLYHIWNIITGQDTHPLWKWGHIWDIHIWNLSTYDTQPIETHFLVTFLVNFQRKRVEISTMCECNLKIVKICQKCANFESGSLSEKLLRIEKVAQNRTSC